MTDSNQRSEILAEIARRAAHYTPEWRYNPENPDAGTALAMLWADMHSGTLERYERLYDNFRRALLDAIGSKARPAAAASGFLAFGVREDAGDFIIPKGTTVAAASNPDAALVTSCDLAASSAGVSGIFITDTAHGFAERLCSLQNINLSGTGRAAAHVWTFSHDFALNTSHAAALRLVPVISGGEIEVLAESAWEYSDGENWHELTVIRDGNSLLCVFPKDKKSCAAVRVSVTRDAVLHSLTAKPSGKDLFPDAQYADSTQVQDGFYPFGRRFIPGACAYFSNADALTKPGARVGLSFTLGYEDFEIEGYPETQIYMRRIMRTSDLKPPEEYTISAAETKWEYYNGVGWAALNIDSDAGLFGTGMGGRIRISFECPRDMSFAVVGAHDLPFIRVRLTGADNLFRQRGRYKAPYISDIRFDYRFESGAEITKITVAEHLDEFVKTLPARLAAPPEGPSALYFAFDSAITRGTILFHIKPGGAGIGTRWEYLSESGWTALGVRDGTEGLGKTGILNYQTSNDARYARLWGQSAYWLRLENGGQADTFLYGLYENAVHAEARTPGEGSALPEGAYTTVVTPLAGVVSAQNPIAVFGGADAEDERRIIKRMSSALSNNGRAVSCGDYEELAIDASVRVLRAKYYPHTDERGAYEYGQSCLVVLARDTEEFGFDELREELLAYITPRCALGAEKLTILPPRYIAVNVSASVIIEGHGEALEVKNRLDKALAQLLAPANWTIGQLPAPGQISAAIRAVSGVVRLARSEASYTMTTGMSADYARAEREAFVLPVCGRHEYTFTSRGYV